MRNISLHASIAVSRVFYPRLDSDIGKTITTTETSSDRVTSIAPLYIKGTAHSLLEGTNSSLYESLVVGLEDRTSILADFTLIYVQVSFRTCEAA